MNFRFLRDKQIITDCDLAHFFGLEPKCFISFFKRNKSIFTQESFFILSEEEKQDLVQNYCATHAERLRYAKRLPFVFTPQGVLIFIFLLKKCAKAKELREKFLIKQETQTLLNFFQNN